MREKHHRLAGGWFGVREKYYCLIDSRGIPSASVVDSVEHCDRRSKDTGADPTAVTESKPIINSLPSRPPPTAPPCLAAPPWHHPPPRARAFRRRRQLLPPRGRDAGRRQSQEAHLRGARPQRTPRPATNAAAGKPRSVPLVASGGSSARRSLPCPPRGGGFHRKTPLPPLPEVFVAFPSLTLLNFWRK